MNHSHTYAYFKTQNLFEIASNGQTHWRYATVAVRMLRTLIRRDVPMSAEMIRLFLDKSHDNNRTIVSPSLNQYCRLD